jgi:hypothetical protein
MSYPRGAIVTLFLVNSISEAILFTVKHKLQKATICQATIKKKLVRHLLSLGTSLDFFWLVYLWLCSWDWLLLLFH